MKSGMSPRSIFPDCRARSRARSPTSTADFRPSLRGSWIRRCAWPPCGATLVVVLYLVNPPVFDAVIIGGGHNGLVCAAYLAGAGASVCIVERRDVVGGA